MAEGILRIAGGADKGHHGVELWISTKQPFAYVKGRPQYIQRSHVQLLHHDPRRLVVRIASHQLNCFIAVLHAPQSGQPLPVREEWWLDTTQLVSELCREHPIVFEHDDSAYSSTPYFLAFLRDLGLCLPCTIVPVTLADKELGPTSDGLTSTELTMFAFHKTSCLFVNIPKSLIHLMLEMPMKTTLPFNLFGTVSVTEPLVNKGLLVMMIEPACPLILKHKSRT